MTHADPARWWRRIPVWLWPLLAVLPLSVALTSCLQEEPEALPYLGVNHTDEWITSLVINGEGEYSTYHRKVAAGEPFAAWRCPSVGAPASK